MAYIRQLDPGIYQVQVRLTGLKPVTRLFSTKTKAKLSAREIEGNSELTRKLGMPTVQVVLIGELVEIYFR